MCSSLNLIISYDVGIVRSRTKATEFLYDAVLWNYPPTHILRHILNYWLWPLLQHIKKVPKLWRCSLWAVHVSNVTCLKHSANWIHINIWVAEMPVLSQLQSKYWKIKSLTVTHWFWHRLELLDWQCLWLSKQNFHEEKGTLYMLLQTCRQRAWGRPLTQGQLVAPICFFYLCCSLLRCCTWTLPSPRDRVWLWLAVTLGTGAWVRLTYHWNWRTRVLLEQFAVKLHPGWARPRAERNFL